MRHVAVLDIGKTNLKVALVDLAAGVEVAVETAPNRVVPGPPWPHFDVAAQEDFLFGALARLARQAPVEGIAVTTHGACAALLAADGSLAAPVMDYEHTGPDALRPAYDALRPDFAEAGSPPLPMGLNLGAQLHFMLTADPGLRDRLAHVVTWPGYWGFRLTGERASDICSLGCHTDLWAPQAGTWSQLPHRLGLAGRMAPARLPGEGLGRLSPAMQARTGLGPVPVLVGIHDSNASLVPHLAARPAPFSVVSTGTWVISMAIGGAPVAPDPARDTLVNVNALGQPVPSARFMGGREFDLMRRPQGTVTEADRAAVIGRGILMLPSVVQGSGPYPDRAQDWTVTPETDGQAMLALGHYLALMTATCLELIGAAGPVIVEGPFAANDAVLSMLATATDRPVLPSQAGTGTAVGAALLFLPQGQGAAPPAASILPDPALSGLAGRWRALAR